MFSDQIFENLFNSSKNRKHQNIKEISKEDYEELKKKAEAFDELLLKYRELENKLENLPNEKELQKLKEKATLTEKYLNTLTQLQADFDNFRKITERENQKFKKYAMEKILFELLRHRDDLERALHASKGNKDFDSLYQGLQMILYNFNKLLETEGVIQINAEGEIFDPEKHEVVEIEKIKKTDKIPDNIILKEIEPGCYFMDRVLRPSKVKIAKICE